MGGSQPHVPEQVMRDQLQSLRWADIHVVKVDENDGLDEADGNTDCYGEVKLERLKGVFPLLPFGKEEDVRMLPTVFMHACKTLMVTPCVDLFATAAHHQLPKYISPDAKDEKVMGYNAFAYKWDSSVTLYANPPWKLIPYVITKICHDRSRVLLVTPLWVDAPWMETLKEITQRSMVWRKKLYLRSDGSV